MERAEAAELLERIARHHDRFDAGWWFDAHLRGKDLDAATIAVDELEAAGERVTPAAFGDAYRRELQDRNARHYIAEIRRILADAQAKQADDEGVTAS